MGCTVSKIERNVERTLPASTVQQKIEQITRRSWWRKGSNSASQLLRPVDLEDDLQVSEPPTPMKEQSPRAENENLDKTKQMPTTEQSPRAENENLDETTQPEKEEETRNRHEEEAAFKEEEKKDAAAEESKIPEAEDANGAKLRPTGVEEANGTNLCLETENLRSGAEEEANGAKLSSITSKDEEMPGSPSFRFYFLEALHDPDNEDFTAGLIKKEEPKLAATKEDKPQPLGRQDSNESTTSSEETDLKRVKKAKAKRLRGLTRAPSAVIRSFLNVRNCYSSQSTAAAANGQENKQLIRVPPVVV